MSHVLYHETSGTLITYCPFTANNQKFKLLFSSYLYKALVFFLTKNYPEIAHKHLVFTQKHVKYRHF